jgi:integrase
VLLFPHSVCALKVARGILPSRRRRPSKDTFSGRLQNPPHGGQGLEPFVLIALHSGVCLLALCALAWEDTDFRNHLIAVEVAYAKKGKARGVPINEGLTEALSVMVK